MKCRVEIIHKPPCARAWAATDNCADAGHNGGRAGASEIRLANASPTAYAPRPAHIHLNIVECTFLMRSIRCCMHVVLAHPSLREHKRVLIGCSNAPAARKIVTYYRGLGGAAGSADLRMQGAGSNLPRVCGHNKVPPVLSVPPSGGLERNEKGRLRRQAFQPD